MHSTELNAVCAAVAFLVSPGSSYSVVPGLVVIADVKARYEQGCSFEDVHCS